VTSTRRIVRDSSARVPCGGCQPLLGPPSSRRPLRSNLPSLVCDPWCPGFPAHRSCVLRWSWRQPWARNSKKPQSSEGATQTLGFTRARASSIQPLESNPQSCRLDLPLSRSKQKLDVLPNGQNSECASAHKQGPPAARLPICRQGQAGIPPDGCSRPISNRQLAELENRASRCKQKHLRISNRRFSGVTRDHEAS
jgi:hypothetical protein